MSRIAPRPHTIELQGVQAPEPGSLLHATSLDDQETPQSDSRTGMPQQPLPPADGGKAAWLVLAGCSLIQAPVWGFSLAFGVFQEHYTEHDTHQIRGNISSIAIIGTTSTGILYLLSPVTFALLTYWPCLRRWCGPVGLGILVVSFVISSFATDVWQLIASQGVLSAVGSGLLFAPTTLYLDEWFIRRKGLAIGIMWAAKSVSGVALPFVMSTCLQHLGSRVTLQAWSVTVLVLTAPLLFFLRPRIPIARSSASRRLNMEFLKLSSFWVLQAGNILQSLGYFLPSAYLASYAVDLGLSPTVGTILIAVLNGTSVFGSIFIGMLNDHHFRVTNVILLSTIGSSLAVFLFWGFSSHVAVLAVFAIIYGFFAGGFSSTWSGIVIELKQESPTLDTGLVFGLLAGGRGIGNVVSGPLSVALMSHYSNWLRDGKSWGYSTEYGPMILFTGVSALLGGWSWIWRCCTQRAYTVWINPRG